MTAPWRPTWDRLLAIRPKLTAREAAKIRGVHMRSAHKAAQKRGKEWRPGWEGEHWKAAQRRRLLRNQKPVTIRGVTYASMNKADLALGVTPGTVSKAAQRGTLDKVGLGRRSPKAIPCVLLGKEYPSIRGAARTLGVQYASLHLAMREGRSDAFLKAHTKPTKTAATVALSGTTRGHHAHEFRVSLPAAPWDRPDAATGREGGA